MLLDFNQRRNCCRAQKWKEEGTRQKRSQPTKDAARSRKIRKPKKSLTVSQIDKQWHLVMPCHRGPEAVAISSAAAEQASRLLPQTVQITSTMRHSNHNNMCQFPASKAPAEARLGQQTAEHHIIMQLLGAKKSLTVMTPSLPQSTKTQ
jgi:hypothetical protein